MLDLSLPGDLSRALAPDLVLMGGAMLLLLWSAWRPDSAAHQRSVGVLSIVLSILVLAGVVWMAFSDVAGGSGVIAVDDFRWMADVVILIATICTLALALDYNDREGIIAGESHVLVLLASSGMMLLVAARDLMIVFLGIELMSIAVYCLAGMDRRSARAAEGALKYFLLGAFSTGFLLYGIALIYGATGATSLEVIASRIIEIGDPINPMLAVGVALLLIGFAFKVAAAPFHMWAPDVYEGAPTPITAYMAAAVKAAAFVALMRIWRESFYLIDDWWYVPVWWLAVVTMAAGNLIALAQRNMKRLLAYSSIAHGGYIFVALATGTVAGSWALLFYVLTYTLATMGAFGVMIALGNSGERSETLDDFAGLWTLRPWLAVAMSVFMLALLGFPVFGGLGFFAKYYLVQASLDSPLARGTLLAVILVLTSVVSAGYYLYVVMVMFMRSRVPTTTPRLRTAFGAAWPARAVVVVTALAIVFFGLFPAPILTWAGRSGLAEGRPRLADLLIQAPLPGETTAGPPGRTGRD
jgi:NADH-quinone oxidoreductase subunit N